jgi:hypothetical protein
MGRDARDKAGGVSARRFLLAALFALAATPAAAGPPYVTDDAEPTIAGSWEINVFHAGTTSAETGFEQAGVSVSYGLMDDYELNATVASAFSQAKGTPDVSGFGDISIGAKIRLLHQTYSWVDVAITPSISFPTHSDAVLGHNGVVPSLGVAAEKDWGDWSVFGGGSCTFPGDNFSQDYCLIDAAVEWQVTPTLQIGGEIYHATPGARLGLHTTGVGVGATYDLSAHYHLLISAGPGIQNVTQADGYTWYGALQITL